MRKFFLHRVPHQNAGRWEYSIRSGGAVVEGLNAQRDELIVPEMLDDLPVRALGCYCLGGMNTYAVRLPQTLEYIGSYAFSQCEALQAVVIPPSVRCMDETAFEDCPEVCLYVEEGSYAHRWAMQMEMPFCFGEPDTSELQEGCFVSGDFICSLTEEATLWIREYTGEARKLVIPDELEGYPVVGLAGHSFACCRTLEEVVVPEGVEMIGGSAFHECVNLRRIWLPDGLRVLGASCFMECEALERIRIPAGVRLISFMCFAGCNALEELELPEMLEEIEPMAFCGCIRLREIELPDGVKSIAKSAFKCCSSLRVPAFPAGLQQESRGAFKECIGWTEEMAAGGTDADGTDIYGEA